MKQTTYNLLVSILKHDESIQDPERERILAACRQEKAIQAKDFPPGAVKISQFARREGVSPRTVYRALKRLQLPHYYLDYRGRLLPEAVRELKNFRR